MHTQYPRQSYLDLIQAQIDANGKDADELMVQRCYEAAGFADLVLDMIKARGRVKDRAYYAQVLASEIERSVFAAIEKSEGEMAEIEAMQTPDPEGVVVSFAAGGRICTVKTEKGDTESFIWRFGSGLNEHFTWPGKDATEKTKGEL